MGASPVKEATLLGGGLTIMSLGIVVALGLSLVVQYHINNYETQLPTESPVLDNNADWPFMSSASGEQSVYVELVAFGPACASITWNATNLLAGAFQYSTAADSITGVAHHNFSCPTCTFRAMSSLDVWLHDSCQSLLIRTRAVSASGLTSVGTYYTSATCPGSPLACATLQSVAVSMTLSLDVLADAAGNVVRGYIVAPTTATPGLNDRPGTVLARTLLALAPSYVNTRVTARVSLAQLISSLLSLNGLIGAVASLLAFIEWLPRRFTCLRRRALLVVDVQLTPGDIVDFSPPTTHHKPKPKISSVQRVLSSRSPLALLTGGSQTGVPHARDLDQKSTSSRIARASGVESLA
jgi:hypothetical protein